MFCTAHKNKVYLIHSAHVRAKRAEFLALSGVNSYLCKRGRHLGNRARDKKSNLTRSKVRCIGDAKAVRTRFDPKVSGSNPGTQYLKKGHVFVTSLPAGNGLGETLKKTLQFADTMKKKKLNRIFTVGATGIPRNCLFLRFRRLPQQTRLN